MNTKLSGAKLVLCEIKRVGRNYLPDIAELRGRVIKYIDFASCDYLPETTMRAAANPDNFYFTIMDQYGITELHRDMPLRMFYDQYCLGVRQPICNKINLQNSYITCNDASEIGKAVPLVFYYDLPEYSARNTTDKVVTDAVAVELITATRYNPFPDVERLQGKRFRRIIVGIANKMPDEQGGVTSSNFDNLFVTLRNGTYKVVENMPLNLLTQLMALEQSIFANIIFDFQSSFITIGGAGTIPNVQTDYIGKSVFFNLQYESK